MHNCVYCDGRAEGYYVEGEFGCDVAVKINALEVLRRELDPKRKRTHSNAAMSWLAAVLAIVTNRLRRTIN